MKTVIAFLACALLVGCESGEAPTECAPGQERIDLDGEAVCADGVHDVWVGGTTTLHSRACSSCGEVKCENLANGHCVSANSHGTGYSYGTMSWTSSNCYFKCRSSN